jgi:Tol biopolymer transport system component
VSASGGKPALALPDVSTPGDRNQRQNPSFLADGRRFVFVKQRSQEEDSEICIGWIDNQESQCVLKAPSPARYTDPGYLIFVRDGVLRLQRFDADRLVASGEALSVSSSQIRATPVFRPPPFSISANVLAFHPGNAAAQLVWRSRSGATVSTVGELGDYASWSASVDERWVATNRTDPRNGNLDIYLNDKNRQAWSRFTFDAAADNQPRFSPDGSRIVFGSTRAGVPGLYVKPTSAAGSEQLLAIAATGATNMGAQDWSSDGRLILYSAFSAKGSWDLGVVAADGRTPGTLVIQSQHGERGGAFSPDMTWIAYDSTESGRREVWIQPFPPSGDRWQVSTTGGIAPQWRRDGKELFYIAADGMLTAVSIGPGTAPVIGGPAPLFQTLHREGGAGFHVSSDGKRFLMSLPPTADAVTPITVRLNWRSAMEQP